MRSEHGSPGTGHFRDLWGEAAQTCSGLCHLKPFIWCLSSGLGCACDGCPTLFLWKRRLRGVPGDQVVKGNNGAVVLRHGGRERVCLEAGAELSVAAAPRAAAL